MTETVQNDPKRQKDLERLRKLRPIDDDFIGATRSRNADCLNKLFYPFGITLPYSAERVIILLESIWDNTQNQIA